MPDRPQPGPTRRTFLAAGTAAVGVAAWGGFARAASAPAPTAAAAAATAALWAREYRDGWAPTV